MRRTVIPLCLLLLCSLGAHAATSSQSSKNTTTSKKSTSSSKSSSTNTKGKAASAPKASSKKSAASGKSTSGKSAVTCKPVKGKNNCATAKSNPAPKTYASPITADSLEKKSGAHSGDEIKARTVPDRAYAIDGQTFFHQGRRIRIEGLNASNATATGEHAKQKLQMLLDSGNLTIDQIAIDDSGVATAQVRVNGRDLAGLLNSN